MSFYVCKMCGRSMKSNEQPKYCYFDRQDAIEVIGDEDSKKMDLFSSKNAAVAKLVGVKNFIPEFPDDVRYNPFTGEDYQIPVILETEYKTMRRYQLDIKERCIAKLA